MRAEDSNTSAVPGALLTAEELAKQLKVNPSYLGRLRHRHGLPYVRVGGEVRFSHQAIRTWLEQRTKFRRLIRGRP
jgi:excisionase family DNA binding protein